MNDGRVDVDDGGIVGEGIAGPMPADISDTDVAKAIIYAAVKTDSRPPIARMKAIETADETPVARRPQEPDPRRRTQVPGTQ